MRGDAELTISSFDVHDSPFGEVESFRLHFLNQLLALVSHARLRCDIDGEIRGPNVLVLALVLQSIFLFLVDAQEDHLRHILAAIESLDNIPLMTVVGIAANQGLDVVVLDEGELASTRSCVGEDERLEVIAEEERGAGVLESLGEEDVVGAQEADTVER